MNYFRCLTLIASLGFAFLASASDLGAVTPRQVAHCMLARMKANQRESYLEAFKVCQEQLDARRRDVETTTEMNSAMARNAGSNSTQTSQH